MKYMDIVVMSKREAEEYAMSKHDKTSVMISISSYGQNKAFIIPNNINKIKEVIFVKFNDTDDAREEFGGIDKSTSNIIKELIDKLITTCGVDSIIVHCEAGRSRSAGIAAAISKFLYNNDNKFFDSARYNPNMLCYRTMLNTLMEV